MTGPRRRPLRLTTAEWSALWGAVIALQGEAEDTDDPDRRRELSAAERAMRKLHREGLAPPGT